MRTYLPVQVLGVLLAVGDLASVSTPFGIGDVVVRTPIVLSNAAAHVIRVVTNSPTKAPAVGAAQPSRSITPADADRAASRPTEPVAHPARLDARNPETIRIKALSRRLAPAGITAAAGITNVAAIRVNRTGSLRHRIDERTSEPVRLQEHEAGESQAGSGNRTQAAQARDRAEESPPNFTHSRTTPSTPPPVYSSSASTIATTKGAPS